MWVYIWMFCCLIISCCCSELHPRVTSCTIIHRIRNILSRMEGVPASTLSGCVLLVLVNFSIHCITWGHSYWPTSPEHCWSTQQYIHYYTSIPSHIPEYSFMYKTEITSIKLLQLQKVYILTDQRKFSYTHVHTMSNTVVWK